MESNLQNNAKPESKNVFCCTPKKEVKAQAPAPGQIHYTSQEMNDDVVDLMETEEIKNETISERKQGYELRKRLISFIREKPILYDPRHSEFSVKRMKNIAWQSIAAQLNLDTDTCQNIWANLRYKYQRYVRRLELFLMNSVRTRSKASTTKRRVLHRPTMPYEVEMMFLYRFINPKLSVTKIVKRNAKVEVKTEAIKLGYISDDDDVVLLNYTEPNIIDLDGEEFRILPYKYTMQVRPLAEAVSAYPELYDTEHRSFHCYRRRGIIWSSIAGELKDKGTKLIKFWMQLLVRYEWEICVGYAPENNGGVMMKPTKLQEMLAFLEPYIRKNPSTVFKQSHFMKKDWFDPLDHFKTVVNLLDTLKQYPQLIKLTDDKLAQKTKPPAYETLWKKVSAAISCAPEQCEITWLVLRSFYWELVELRKEGYYLQDKWYFELVIANLYKIVNESCQFQTPTTLPPMKKRTKIPATKAQSTITTNTLERPKNVKTKPPIKNTTITQTQSTSFNLTNESEIRMPKIVAAVSLAPILSNMGPPCTPRSPRPRPPPPFLQMQPPARPVMPPLAQLGYAPIFNPRPPILSKPAVRAPLNPSLTVSLRTNRPTNNQFQLGPVFTPLLFPAGATTSQNLFVRPVAPKTQTTSTTTIHLPLTTICNGKSNGKETNPLLLNLIRLQPPTTAPIVSVRPQTQISSVNEKQQQQSFHMPPPNIVLAENKITPNNYTAILNSGLTIKANTKPTVNTKTNASTLSTVDTLPSIDLTAVLMPPLINVARSVADTRFKNSNNKTLDTTIDKTRTAATETTLEAPTHISTAAATSTTTTMATSSSSSTPTVLNTIDLACMLNPNQIMIELISNNKNKQIVVHGPALSTTYSLSMSVTVDFIREIMAIPILHNKQTTQVAKANTYWQHVSKKFNMPVHICKACWNFLADNVTHFPKIAPMTELMRPFKSSLKVWAKTQKLFRRFHVSSLKKGWLKHKDDLPKLLKFLEPYTFLYKDVRRYKPSVQPTTEEATTEDKINVWKKARELYPNIAHPVEIWLAFKLVFVRYMIELEDGLENSWQPNWWPALAQLSYLISARYDRMDPFYYIATNKFDEELNRCQTFDSLAAQKKTNVSKPKDLPATTSLASISKSLTAFRGVDAYELTRLVCSAPPIYKRSSVLVQNGAWLRLSKRLNVSVRECVLTLQYVLRRYLEFKTRDPTNSCHLNKKYYKYFDYIFRIVKTRIQDDKSKCTLIELLLQNEPPAAVYPRQFIPDINMHNSSASLVMKNLARAARHLPDENLCVKMKSIFEKYRSSNLSNTKQ